MGVANCPSESHNHRDSYNAGGGAPIMDKPKDQDRSKGAMERDGQNEVGNTGMQRQLGHRDQDSDVKDADSDQPG